MSVHEVKAVSVSSTSILVTWRRPAPPSGRIAHYVIQIKDTMTQDVVRFIKFQNLEFVFLLIQNFSSTEKVYATRNGKHFGTSNWPAGRESSELPKVELGKAVRL